MRQAAASAVRRSSRRSRSASSSPPPPAKRAKNKARSRPAPAPASAPAPAQPQTDNPSFPSDGLPRCGWCLGSSKPDVMEAYVRYHDEEWGVEVRDEKTLFEFFTLEGAQAGLSWATILMKREGYRRAFDGWDVERIAAYDDDKVAELLADPGIVRNRLKVSSTVSNARLVLVMRDGPVTFPDLLWSFVGGKQRVTRHARLADVPLVAAEASEMSRELKKRGFRFCGPTMCTSLMEATGMVCHHLTSCHRHPENRSKR